jgi:hypothetical protein
MRSMDWAFLLTGLMIAGLLTGYGSTHAQFEVIGFAPNVSREMAPNDPPIAPQCLPDPGTDSGVDQRIYCNN